MAEHDGRERTFAVLASIVAALVPIAAFALFDAAHDNIDRREPDVTGAQAMAFGTAILALAGFGVLVWLGIPRIGLLLGLSIGIGLIISFLAVAAAENYASISHSDGSPGESDNMMPTVGFLLIPAALAGGITGLTVAAVDKRPGSTTAREIASIAGATLCFGMMAAGFWYGITANSQADAAREAWQEWELEELRILARDEWIPGLGIVAVGATLLVAIAIRRRCGEAR